MLPLVHNNQMEGAVTLDFYNLSHLNLEESNNELQNMMRRGMNCMNTLKTIIFTNFIDEMEED